jgi:hypothetical protein
VLEFAAELESAHRAWQDEVANDLQLSTQIDRTIRCSVHQCAESSVWRRGAMPRRCVRPRKGSQSLVSDETSSR